MTAEESGELLRELSATLQERPDFLSDVDVQELCEALEAGADALNYVRLRTAA